jgi:hypothetical protein
MRTERSTARFGSVRSGMLVILSVVLLGALLPPAASASPTGSFSCRASAARIALAGGTVPTIEPFIANGADAPCLADTENVLTPTTVGPLSVNAVNVTTVITSSDAGASSTVTNPTVTLGGLVVHADVLSAAAGYRCVNGTAQPFTSGQVVALTIDGHTIAIPPGTNVTVPLGPLGTLVLNQVLTSSTAVVRRAVALVTPLGTIIISEATADLSGTPCASSATTGATKGTAHLVVTPTGTARLIAANRCVNKTFDATVLGTEISRVVFSVDGKRLATRNSSPYRVAIDPTPGHHVLTARVTFLPASDTAPRTLRLPYTGCGVSARLVITPRAAARLIASHVCVRNTFFATVVGVGIQRVVFSLDGTGIGTRTGNPFRVAVHPTPGPHTLLARVTFRRSSHVGPRVLRVAFSGCPGPRFTG